MRAKPFAIAGVSRSAQAGCMKHMNEAHKAMGL